MSASDQETYIKRLGELGYCWQFITLAGLHSTALISDTFAKAFAARGMRAYGNLIQEPEMENQIDVVTHQKWSGANLIGEFSPLSNPSGSSRSGPSHRSLCTAQTG